MLLLALALLAASWLDSPLTQWNTPGAAVPTAPPTTNPDPRCRTSEVAPVSPEDNMLAARGWRLESFWPAQTSGTTVLRAALAEYDGMCRPFEFNVFVFSNGQFAGTLSPIRMLSRTDGSLFGMPILNTSTTMRSSFIRYADTDPLCCPSRGTTTVSYALQNGVVVALRAAAGSPAQVPSQLPATGSISEFGLLPFAAGAALLLLGFLIRKVRIPSKYFPAYRFDRPAVVWGRYDHQHAHRPGAVAFGGRARHQVPRAAAGPDHDPRDARQAKPPH